VAWRCAPIGHPDRETARTWADLYRWAMAEPDGVLCVCRDKDGSCLWEVDAKNPDTLVRLLENFAHHGTFENKNIDSIVECMKLRIEFRALLNEGNTKDEAVELLSEKHRMRGRGYSRSNIERKLGLRR